MAAGCVIAAATPVWIGGDADASPSCSRAVIFTTPGLTWEDVARSQPPTLLSLARRGAIGSLTVHTDVSRPSYSSAFTSLGAGARVPTLAASAIVALPGNRWQRGVRVTSRSELHALSERSGYGAKPGALAGALDTPVVAVDGVAAPESPEEPATDWPLLAAMDPSGRVDYVAGGGALLGGRGEHLLADRAKFSGVLQQALRLSCATLIVDTGDLERALERRDRSSLRSQALMNTDQVLGEIARLLDPQRDLLLVVSPTSPPEVTHLGVAIAVGPGFPPGDTLESASTRRPGIVTLPDVAPTVLSHFDVGEPPGMTGQRFFSTAGQGDRIVDAVELDREAVFIDGTKPAIAWVFLAVELVLFAAALVMLRLGSPHRPAGRGLELIVVTAALAVASLPLVTYLIRFLPATSWGRPAYVGLCVLIDAAVVGCVSLLRAPALAKLCVVAGASLLLMLGDLATGGHLQLNSIMGDSPLIAGRFAGAGNNAFAIMAGAAVVAATFIVWRGERRPAALAIAAIIFAVVVLVDGAPQLGSDVGGVLALVPGFAAAWLLLGGRRVSLKLVVVGVAAAVVAAGLFIAIDVARPPEQRTHLGRFFEDVRSRGGSAFIETVRRKAASNLGQATYLQNLYRFLPAAFVTALFLFWPARWWRWLGSEQPVLRAGLIGALVVAVLGSALNDSGIAIFTTMLLFIAPLAILIRLRFPGPASVIGG